MQVGDYGSQLVPGGTGSVARQLPVQCGQQNKRSQRQPDGTAGYVVPCRVAPEAMQDFGKQEWTRISTWTIVQATESIIDPCLFFRVHIRFDDGESTFLRVIQLIIQSGQVFSEVSQGPLLQRLYRANAGSQDTGRFGIGQSFNPGEDINRPLFFRQFVDGPV